MKLPNAENAFIDARKLVNYALDVTNSRGQHKARVFTSALGITVDNVDVLRNAISKCVLDAEAAIGELDFYGQRYAVDCRIKTGVGEATVRTGWIIRRSESFPRLTTCYVLKEKRTDETKDRTS